MRDQREWTEQLNKQENSKVELLFYFGKNWNSMQRNLWGLNVEVKRQFKMRSDVDNIKSELQLFHLLL